MTSSNPYPGQASYPGRVGIQQRVLPAYRVPFFDALAQECQGGLSVFAGQAASEESIQSADQLSNACYFPAHNRHFGKVSSATYLCWQPGLIGWLESWQPAVLILEANARYQSTRRAIDWMHARRRPVIGWGLGAPGSGKNKGGLRFNLQLAGRRRFLQNFDSLIAYSNRGAKEYCGLGFPAERIFVAPNAVAHRPEFSPIIRPRASSDPLTVLFVGRLQARKRVNLLLHACAALPAGLQPRLVVVGEGPAREELRQLAAGVYPRANFAGAVYADALEEYFNQADLFVLPGTGGLALQQAMAHGLPVIAAEGDGTQEDLVREENGWLVTPGDLQALVRTLSAALSNPIRLAQMGLESYKIVRDQVNLETMITGFLIAIEHTTSFYSSS